MKFTFNKAVAVDGGICRPFQIWRSCPAATEPHRSNFMRRLLPLLCIAVFALGMVPREPTPVVYSSLRGRFIVRVEPGEYSHGTGSGAIARVFEFNAHKKSYEPRATFKLENEIMPVKVHITDDCSRVVVVDDWYNDGFQKPVIVIHDGSGAVIKRFHLQELLSREEIEELKPRHGQLYWSNWKIATNLMLDSNELFVARDDLARGPGKKYDNFFIDLKSFKIKKETLE